MASVDARVESSSVECLLFWGRKSSVIVIQRIALAFQFQGGSESLIP
jgi:hypothetical protein